MDPSPNFLKKLPIDLLSLIVAQVGKASPVDYVNASLSCKDLNVGSDNYFVAKDLNLKPLIQKPRRAKYYPGLMESCLKRGNVDAHYVQAAKLGHKEARLIYGVLLMSFGATEKGKKYLTKLRNEHGVATLETTWSTIRTSLKGIELHMKKVYRQSQAKMTPEINCHQTGPITDCPNCFHRRFLNEFVTLMMGVKQPV